MRYHFVTGIGEVTGHNFNCPMTETGAYRIEGLDYVDVFLTRNSDRYLWNKPIMRMRLWQPAYFCDSLNPEVRDYWNDRLWCEHMYEYRDMIHIDQAWRPLAQPTTTLMHGDIAQGNRFTDFILQKMRLKE